MLAAPRTRVIGLSFCVFEYHRNLAMRLLRYIPLLHISCRGSRNSVSIYRHRRSLLKHFRAERKADANCEQANVYQTLNAPIERIAPISSEKTAITIDILGEETYPTLSEWRRQHLVRRARRVLPLPISLTTDDQIGRVWKQRYRDSIPKDGEHLSEKEKLLQEIPEFVRLMNEKDPALLKCAFPEIYANFNKLMSLVDTRYEKNDDKKAEIVEKKLAPYFPFVTALKNMEPQASNNQVKVINEDDIPNNELLDEEYENYLKHNEMLQYFASNLNDIHRREYDPEIKGWSSQIWLRNYGRPDPSIAPSKVPCSGCGAHLHCSASNIPGFMPSEKFTLFSESELYSQLCQRCDFLQRHNVALNVTVPEDQYPQLISKIQHNPSLVIILVDLLDFPCSVWPGIINLIGEKQRVYIVGNKVDLLPKDDNLYLERTRKSLKEMLKLVGIGPNANIRDISLISAKTGFGIENLVTKLLRDIRKGEDIYLIGCTNSGKSTLFNALMQTDLCALREADLITRATTSLWPGTTLNLLKFPVRKLAGWEMQMRLNRLEINEKKDIAQRRLAWTMRRQSNPQIALLSERIGSTFRRHLPRSIPEDHPFAKNSALIGNLKPFDPNDRRFKNCNSLCDTPGVIYKDQLLNLFTTEELLRVIPREIITPRTYTLRPGQSLFIGGLARIDLTHARQQIWLTIFASRYLPINIVYSEQARKFYDMNLGTEILSVPMGTGERLERWPRLLPKELTIDCIGWEESCADIVLSNAGWVAVTGGHDTKCVMRAFTPEGRGIFVRNPPMLPYAIRLRGKRIVNTPCFENKLYTIDDLTERTIPRSFSRYDSKHITDERVRKAVRFVDPHSTRHSEQ